MFTLLLTRICLARATLAKPALAGRTLVRRGLLILLSLGISLGAINARADELKPQIAFYSLSHWQQLYGDEMRFNVTRNQKPVGSYRVGFSGSESDWQVDSRMALDFKAFLFFSYRFRYQGLERWQGNQMLSFKSDIDRNGELSRTLLQRAQDNNGLPFWQGGVWELADAEETQVPPQALDVLTNASRNLALSNHYNRSIIGQNQLFNSLSGQLNQISLVKEQTETVSDGQSNVQAIRYRYTGDLEDTWVWYANDGRWLRMRFIADDGSTIQLNCERCYRP